MPKTSKQIRTVSHSEDALKKENQKLQNENRVLRRQNAELKKQIAAEPDVVFDAPEDPAPVTPSTKPEPGE